MEAPILDTNAGLLIFETTAKDFGAKLPSIPAVFKIASSVGPQAPFSHTLEATAAALTNVIPVEKKAGCG
jgi:hypothetical protein